MMNAQAILASIAQKYKQSAAMYNSNNGSRKQQKTREPKNVKMENITSKNTNEPK